MSLALCGVDFSVESQLEVVSSLEGVRVTSEGEARGLKVKLQVLLRNVGDGDGKVNEILLRVGVGGTLSP